MHHCTIEVGWWLILFSRQQPPATRQVRRNAGPTHRMLKSSLLLACLVPAAGQAATRDTTQWRCRNRKLSCKKWAADNQCTANYPFMAEGVAPQPPAGTWHMVHGTRSVDTTLHSAPV